MLSDKKLKTYKQQLNIEKEYCILVRKGTESLKNKLKQKTFFDDNNIKYLYELKPNKNYENLTRRTA